MSSKMRGLLTLLCLAIAPAGCTNVSKIDYTSLHEGRGAWQQPERVVAALELQPGDRVADLGAGEGYFLPYLAQAVGPTGKVYAVEVEEKLTKDLETLVVEEGFANVDVVLGEYTDPLLPDGQIDVVLIVNTYHHIEERRAYFSQLQRDLTRDGLVAVVEPDADLDGVLGLFLDEGHTSSAEGLNGEMREAGYRNAASFDFLPTQVFEVFAVRAGAQ